MPIHSERNRLTDRDRRLVELVCRCRLLSRDQIMRVAPFNSLTRVNTRLAFLVHERLLSRKMMPSYPGHGGAQALYFCGPQAEALGIERERLTRQIRQVRRWDLRYTTHVVAANEILTTFIAGLRDRAASALLSFKTEPELREIFVNQPLVPDGWIAWSHDGRRFNAFVEVDLHHEGLTEWRLKVVNYLQYGDASLHAELFGYRSFRVLVVAKSTARLSHLRQIAEAAGRRFLFGRLSEITTTQVFGATWLPAMGSPIALTEA